jgi:hypothetical protein
MRGEPSYERNLWDDPDARDPDEMPIEDASLESNPF